MRIRSSTTDGFTLIELLIATTVFSIILLAASATLIQISRLYYKGVITSKTQNVARSVSDDLSRAAQFSSGPFTATEVGGTPTRYVVCIGTTRFTAVRKQGNMGVAPQVSDKIPNGAYNTPEFPNKIRHVLWQDKIAANEQCTDELPDMKAIDPSPPDDDFDREGKELLENNMRLGKFSVSQTPGKPDLLAINIQVVYGDDELLDNPSDPTACKSSQVGGQWCAISDLSSVVYRRVE